MGVCGEVELNRNRFVVGIPYAADHKTVVYRRSHALHERRECEHGKQEREAGSLQVMH